jgi:hypothetical protein
MRAILVALPAGWLISRMNRRDAARFCTTIQWIASRRSSAAGPLYIRMENTSRTSCYRSYGRVKAELVTYLGFRIRATP